MDLQTEEIKNAILSICSAETAIESIDLFESYLPILHNYRLIIATNEEEPFSKMPISNHNFKAFSKIIDMCPLKALVFACDSSSNPKPIYAYETTKKLKDAIGPDNMHYLYGKKMSQDNHKNDIKNHLKYLIPCLEREVLKAVSAASQGKQSQG